MIYKYTALQNFTFFFFFFSLLDLFSNIIFMEITSEILPFFQRDLQSKPCINSRNIVSKFSFSCPDSLESDARTVSLLEKDDDGDYIVTRKNTEKSFNEIFISLEHDISTELKLVGLQIWRGAFLLADYLIHNRSKIEGETVLELGAGVGLTSVVAGMYAKQIVCTDVDRGDILKLLRCNIERNTELIQGIVMVEELDFFNEEWSAHLRDKMKEVSVILAADVIYDNDVTEAFIKTIARILDISPKKTLYLAMEKRYVFTLEDLDSVAPCYEHMLTCLEKAKRTEPFYRWTVQEIPLNFPQYFNYERVKEMVMFKISS